MNEVVKVQLRLLNREPETEEAPAHDRTTAEYLNTAPVSQMRIDVANRLNLQPDQIDLLYHGRLLEEDKTLHDYGISSGELIYVIPKDDPLEIAGEDPQETSKYLNNCDCDMLMNLYKETGLPNSRLAFCNAIKMCIEQDAMKDLIDATPGLANDPIGVSFLNEPELIYWLQEEETFKNIKNKHPGVIIAIMRKLSTLTYHQIGNILEDADVDVLGDEDDDEETGGDQSLITAEQLTAALAMAGFALGNGRDGAGASTAAPSDSSVPAAERELRLVRDLFGPGSDAPSQSTSGLPGPSTRQIITSDMFSNALSRAMSAATAGDGNDSSSSDHPMTSGLDSAESPSASDVAMPPNDYSEQLAKMREMGLVDDRINLRALIVSAGDVNAAINLVLSGAIED